MQKLTQPLSLEHLKEMALPAPNALPALTHQTFDEAPDLFLWCVDDITLKLMKQDAIITIEFRENLYRSIFTSTLNIAFKELEETHIKSISEFIKLNTLDEVLFKLSELIDENPELGFVFNKSLITAYVTKSMDYAIEADPFMSSMLYN
jgi:hypothetical protein